MLRVLGSLLVTTAAAQPNPGGKTGKLGAEANAEYVNAAITMNPWQNVSGGALSHDQMDTAGWPKTDVQVTMFDDRPMAGWWWPAQGIDDPLGKQQDFSGEWKLKLVGNAVVSVTSSQPISQQKYDPATNTFTATITMPKGTFPAVQNLLGLKFTDTQRTPKDPKGSGFVNFTLNRPGYEGRESQLMTDNWAKLMKTFDHLRWMGATGTNSYFWTCGGENAGGCSVVEWADRNMPSFASTRFGKSWCKGCYGVPWEHVLLAANELNSDVWINVPVTASAPTLCQSPVVDPKEPGGDPNADPHSCVHKNQDPTETYEYQLAKLFKDGNEFTGGVGLKPNLNLYVEHSNEVWNFGFPQYGINKALAVWEVQNGTTQVPLGKSNLDDDAKNAPWMKPGQCKTDQECWTHRRHARRCYEIAKTFEKVFGDGSLNNRVRVVYSSWTISLQEYYNNTLT